MASNDNRIPDARPPAPATTPEPPERKPSDRDDDRVVLFSWDRALVPSD